jgi:hypothetical protein
MANYTKNDLDVKLLDENQRVEYEFEFLKHDIYENLDANKTAEGIASLRKSQKSFGEMMSSKDEEAGEKYRIADKILMVAMMCSMIALLVLVLVFFVIKVYNIFKDPDGENSEKMDEAGKFIFKIILTFILLLVILFLVYKGLYYIINNIKVSRKFLHTV